MEFHSQGATPSHWIEKCHRRSGTHPWTAQPHAPHQYMKARFRADRGNPRKIEPVFLGVSKI